MDQVQVPTAVERARATLGSSDEAIYRLVARVVRERRQGGGTLIDVGCGTGNLWKFVGAEFDRYLGADVVLYEGFPSAGEFCQVDLDNGRVPLPDGAADVVASVETIEHVENPRALVREITRLARPGGLVIVTTPNQLSLLSKLSLVLKNRFSAFADGPGLYPAHITALLEIDLVRIARECGLEPRIYYTDCGRIPGTARHWPRRLRGRAFSDNVLIVAEKPA
jgi:SAM-dependent methyltransferase